MKQSLIVVEGPDDVAALREVFQRRFGWRKAKDQTPPAKGEHPFQWPDAETTVLVAQGKPDIPKRIVATIRDIETAERHYSQLGICFDPDTHTGPAALDWLVKECQLAGNWNADGICPVSISDGSVVDVIALPWDLGPIFNELADFRNLERVALAVLAKTDVAEGELITELLKKVQSAGRKVSWKTAFRLWAAVRYADKDPDTGGAMAQVFGQDEAARTSLDSVLCNSVFLSRLKRFAGTPAA